MTMFQGKQDFWEAVNSPFVDDGLDLNATSQSTMTRNLRNFSLLRLNELMVGSVDYVCAPAAHTLQGSRTRSLDVDRDQRP